MLDRVKLEGNTQAETLHKMVRTLPVKPIEGVCPTQKQQN